VGSACLRWSLHPARRRSHDERCPSGSGRGSVLTGARKDACDPSDVARYRQVPLAPVRPLAGETSASRCQHDGAGPRPHSCAGQRSRTRCRDGVVGRGFGRACRRRPSAAKVRRGSGSSVREPMPETEAGGARERSPALALVRGAGIRRSAVVLADRTGCRSRRGALDPGRKVEERAISAMEGVLARHGLLSLTRRRPDRASGPEAMGMRQRCRIRRGDR